MVTALGEGYSGYTRSEIGELWQEVAAGTDLPGNLHFVRFAETGDCSMT